MKLIQLQTIQEKKNCLIKSMAKIKVIDFLINLSYEKEIINTKDLLNLVIQLMKL